MRDRGVLGDVERCVGLGDAGGHAEGDIVFDDHGVLELDQLQAARVKLVLGPLGFELLHVGAALQRAFQIDCKTRGSHTQER